MTEAELIEKQRVLEGKAYYLMKVGMFYHAYENGAFALARLMDYRVKRKVRKGEKVVLVAGFPVGCLEKVSGKMFEAGIDIRPVSDNDNLFLFSGADGTPDESYVDRREKEPDVLLQVGELIRSFNLGGSTPLEAMNFVDRLQRMLHS